MKVTKSLTNKVNKLVELLSDKDVMRLFLESENEEIVENLCELLSEHEEGVHVLRTLSANQVVNHWDERGELHDLKNKVDNSFPITQAMSPINDYPCNKNNKFFRELLCLNEWASKDEIINELNNRIL